MTKTLYTLIEKAQAKGGANLNGRVYDGYSVSELKEKYHVSIDKDTLELRHWGTPIVTLDLTNQVPTQVYMQSNSDRDAINDTLRYFGIPYVVSYRPMTDGPMLVESSDNSLNGSKAANLYYEIDN